MSLNPEIILEEGRILAERVSGGLDEEKLEVEEVLDCLSAVRMLFIEELWVKLHAK